MNLDSLIKAKQESRKTRPERISLYALPGWGKTTFLSSFPNTFFLDCEQGDGLLDLRGADIDSLEKFNNTITLLIKEKHSFKHVVIDTVTSLEKMVHIFVCKKFEKFSIVDFGFQEGYKQSRSQFMLIQRKLDGLVSKGISVSLTYHVDTKQGFDHLGDVEIKKTPAIHKYISNDLIGWSSNLFFGDIEKTAHEEQAGFSKVTKVRSEGQRVIYTDSRQAFEAKNRMGLPFIVKWNKGQSGHETLEKNKGKG